MEMLGAIVLVFALQKIAALLSIPVILGMIWVKGKASRMDGEAWEQYFRQVSKKKRRNDNRCASFLIKCKIKPVQTPNESQLGSIPFEFAQFGHDPLFPVPA